MVEYFYMLIGYFTSQHFSSNENFYSPEKSAFQYMLKKVRNIFPYAVVGIIINCLLLIVKGDIQLKNFTDLFVELPLHLLMLKSAAFVHYDLNGALWFMTGIILLLPPLVILLIKKRDLTIYYLSWSVPIICYMFLYEWHGRIFYFDRGVQFHLVIRCAAALYLGIAVYGCSNWLSSINIGKDILKYLPAFEIIFYFAVVFLSFFQISALLLSRTFFYCFFLFVLHSAVKEFALQNSRNLRFILGA